MVRCMRFSPVSGARVGPLRRRCGDRAKGCGSRAMNAESAGAVVMLRPSSPWGRRSLGGKAPVYLSAALLPPLAQREEVAALLADVGGRMRAPAVESRRRWGRSRPSSSPAGGDAALTPLPVGLMAVHVTKFGYVRAGGWDPVADHPGARRPRVDGTDGARHRRAEHPRVRRAAPPRARRGRRRTARASSARSPTRPSGPDSCWTAAPSGRCCPWRTWTTGSRTRRSPPWWPGSRTSSAPVDVDVVTLARLGFGPVTSSPRWPRSRSAIRRPSRPGRW